MIGICRYQVLNMQLTGDLMHDLFVTAINKCQTNREETGSYLVGKIRERKIKFENIYFTHRKQIRLYMGC